MIIKYGTNNQMSNCQTKTARAIIIGPIAGKLISRLVCAVIGVFLLSLPAMSQRQKAASPKQKIVIYQLLPRLFGNKKTVNIPYGTISENGSGKFNDITDRALEGLKQLHVNYVWYTGVIAHASLTDYSAYGIKVNDADVVKGRAGSPYAIRDYYDVDPDLAVNVNNRMKEFEALVHRTHAKNLKVLIDFVPNHVAREYHSSAKPSNVVDFGAEDDVTKSFSTKNDFYYLPGQHFLVPDAKHSQNAISARQDGNFNESPAKVTGNNVFAAQPKADDWYETIKLNYGVDNQNGEKKYFDPIPPVWVKMRDILIYWAHKGVDGFRCDVAEMVPVEFWNWVIPQVKKVDPSLIFIGEAYNPQAYQQFLTVGKFDYLYDKVGLYDGLKRLIKNEPTGDVKDIKQSLADQSARLGDHMLRFLENHDEERIASPGFAGHAELALPAMVVSATLSGGPVMLYFGQEVGEPGKGVEGFGGEDNRTTIFDYWGVPNHQQWMNNGAFDGKALSTTGQNLRAYYVKLLRIATQNDAIINGKVCEVPLNDSAGKHTYAFIRYTAKQRLLIVVNFDRTKTLETAIKIPAEILNLKLSAAPVDLLTNKQLSSLKGGILTVKAGPVSAQIIQF